MLRFTKAIAMKMSIKNKLVKITKDVTDFLTIDQGGVIRTVPTSKQRKYRNVEIAEDFKKIDDKRKKERLQNMKKRQMLLQKKIKDQQLLLSADSEAIKAEIANIQKNIQQSNKELTQLQKTIENTQGQYMLVESYMKIAVTNHIKYLQYIHNHNTAFTLHPQTIKAIQNVQYCVQHNLPVKRINLYEIMPEYFEAQIGELEDSIQKLIAQKNIFIENEDETKSIRFFYKVQKQRDEEYGPEYVEGQITRAFDNMYLYCHEKLDKHHQLIDDVIKGKTVYRGIQHLMTVLLSNLPIKFLPEEEQLRKDLLEIVQLKEEFSKYKAYMQEQIEKLKWQYIPPPSYIKNHPLLFQKYQQLMEKYQNPLPLHQAQFLVQGDKSEGILREKMEEQIRKVVYEKYDKHFIEAMNNDRSLIDKKQIQIDFYNLSTNIYENFLALQDKSKSEQQLFVALPQQKSLLTTQKKKNLIPLNHLTRMVYLNSRNKTKYNLSFFAQWFGVDKQELRSSLKYFSYLRALPSSLKEGQQLKTQVLKFQD